VGATKRAKSNHPTTTIITTTKTRIIATKKDRTAKARSGSSHKSRERGGKYNTPRKNSNASSEGNTPASSRQGSRQRVREQEALVEAGLAQAGDFNGWSEEDMFQVNERILGRKIEYDGNPHFFAEHGFDGKDPHAFHVVGGTFLNSEQGGISSLAPPPQQSKLQPLFRKGGDDNNDDELQPFFSDEGATPWGHVVDDAKQEEEERAAAAAAAANRSARPRGGSVARTIPAVSELPAPVMTTGDGLDESLFFTDQEITQRSQAVKIKQQQQEDPIVKLKALQKVQQEQYEADMAYIRQWVANLPKPRATPHFGEFKLDAAAIVEKAMKDL